MFVTLFRHAERENTGLENPGLTARGFQQAQSLLKIIQANQLPAPQRLFVSPKIRTQQTFLPTANQLNLPLQILPELDERRNSETITKFVQRVQRFINLTSQDSFGPQSSFLCSHLDWIEEALLKIPCDVDLLQSRFQIWAPGQFIQFEVHDELWHFIKAGELTR